MSKAKLEWANFRESLTMAFAAIRGNKLRSILTLLGIVVGVFSIISVMTAMAVLRNSIEEGITQLGANTFQLQKFPPGGPGGGDHDRWRFRNRKNITIEQAQAVKDNLTLAESVGLEVWRGGRIIWWNGQKTNPNVILFGENPEGLVTNDWVVETGRGITPQDLDFGRDVIVIGLKIREKLFPPQVDPVGEKIRVDGRVYEVVGVFAKKGSALGGDNDNFVVIPLSTYFEQYGRNASSVNIMVKAKSRDVVEDAIEQSRAILRTARNVPPGEEDDFGYFSNDSAIRQFNEFTKYLRLGVAVVSSIALLAAGIGIMNIMLVSVTERTREIGIRKAVGAQKRDVLRQFLIEAVILCQAGGLLGIFVGILVGNVVSVLLEVPPVIPWDWVGYGVLFCTGVGLVFGVYPAWKAANLDPIEALRYE